MPSLYAVGGSFLVALGGTSLSDTDLERIASSPELVVEAATALKEIVEKDRARERDQHSARMKILNSKVQQLGLDLDLSGRLAEKGRVYVRDLLKSSVEDLHNADFMPYETVAIEAALLDHGLGLRKVDPRESQE